MRLLQAFADLGIRRPWTVIGMSLALLAVCGALAATLRVDSSRHTMVAADNPHQQLQLAYFERFGLPDAMLFVLRGGSADARRALGDAIVDRLEVDPELRGRALARLGPDQVAELLLLGDPSLRPDGLDPAGYLASPDGAQHYVMVFPQLAGTQQAHEVRPTVERLRAVRDAALAEAPLSGITADLTGPAVLVVDEEREIQRGIVITSGATAGAILLLLLAAFRSIRHALLALVPVVVGVAGTMAVARVVYGELNMVTSSCSSILLGLGIDSGVFLLSRYGEYLRGGMRSQEAIRHMVLRSGVALCIGAVTTAVAFLTTTTTEFTAYARLGVIVAIGLLLMVATSLFLLPALLEVSGRRSTPVPPALRVLGPLRAVVTGAPRVWIVLGAAGVVAGVLALPHLRFNTRFYDFIPDHVEGARALLAIERDPLVTPLRATVPAEGVEEARALAAQLRALPAVASVQTPTDALPPLDTERLRNRLDAMPPSDAEPDALRRARETARAVLERGAYLPTDLPELLRMQFVSRDGEAIGLQVIPAGDIWDPATAREFARQVSGVAPAATGMAMHIDAHLRFIREGFTRAAAAAAVLMLLAVAVAFRSVRDGALSLLPCAVGFAWMLGVLGHAGIAFDAANIVVLPLILGIGVDAGVHLIERVRQSEAEHGVALVSDVLLGTGSAVLVSSVTTAAGFAALMLAEYGAMRSLGLVMTIGVTCCALASLVLLPAILLATGRLRREPAGPAGST